MKGKGAVVHIFKRPELPVRAVVIGAGQYQSRISVAAGHFNDLAVIFGLDIIIISDLAENPRLVRSEGCPVKLDASVGGSAHIDPCAAGAARHDAVFFTCSVALQIVFKDGRFSYICIGAGVFLILYRGILHKGEYLVRAEIMRMQNEGVAVIRARVVIVDRESAVQLTANFIVVFPIMIEGPELLVGAVIIGKHDFRELSSIPIFDLKHLFRFVVLEIIVSVLFVDLEAVRFARCDFPKLRIAVIGYIKRA